MLTLSSSYVFTALTLDRFTNYLGRFPLNSSHRPIFPILRPNAPREGMGFSLTQGRCFLMMLAACSHLCFFTLVASSPTFAGLLVAFMFNGFAKGYIIGRPILIRSNSHHNIIENSLYVSNLPSLALGIS